MPDETQQHEAHMRDPLWTPGPERIEAAAMTTFRRRAASVAHRDLSDYDALHAWSVEKPEAFWRMLADEWMRWREPPWRTRSDDAMPGTRWFEGGTANVVDRLLWPDGVEDDDTALIGAAERGEPVRWSWRTLRREVARVQSALRAAGLREGDAVAAYAANVPETVALFLACAADGLVFTSGSPDFGAEAATARFAQVRPKALFASPASDYGGRRHDTAATVTAIAASLPEARLRVSLPIPGEADERQPRHPAPAGFVTWSAFVAPDAAVSAPETRPFAFDQPIYVLYSSGTTGRPKAIRHRAGGALLTQWKELRLHSDVGPRDVVSYYTTTGWMMWNWLVAALGVGATIVLVDGSPVWPDPLRMFRLTRELGITFFGTSARFLHGLAAAGVRPADLDMPTLRTVASTGSPLSPAGFEYVYDHVARDVHLASISGGTDIVSCFLLGVPTLPVYAGQLQRPGLGVDLAIVDEDGRELDRGAGELVCRAPLPSMPLGFVDDPGETRYRAAYFERFPGVWRHGDRIDRRPEGGFVHHGRSDATLNPGGVRIGSAEVTTPVLALPWVVDAAAVARRIGSDEEIWLLVVPVEGVSIDGDRKHELRVAIREGASPRHLPARIVELRDLPRTRSGKTMELAITDVVNGRPPANAASAANEPAFEALRDAVARGQATS